MSHDQRCELSSNIRGICACADRLLGISGSREAKLLADLMNANKEVLALEGEKAELLARVERLRTVMLSIKMSGIHSFYDEDGKEHSAFCSPCNAKKALSEDNEDPIDVVK